ncbi:MAG: RICIN domain-containing protein [Bryobacteraceae bacterium]
MEQLRILGLLASLKRLTRWALSCAGVLCLFAGGGFTQNLPVLIQVPADLRSPPFDTDRYLNVPPQFSVSLWARVPGARFMAVAPDGDILVSQPWAGNILLLQDQGDGEAAVSVFASGLELPHDMVFHGIGQTMYLYVAEANQIDRFVYNWRDRVAHNREILITGLPSASSPELGGAYAHQLKNMAVDSMGRLYVSIGSATNADPSDRFATPMRGAIYQYQPDGSGGRLFAAGLRNAEGVRFLPGTDSLWAAVNNRDNLAYPFDDGSGLFGQVLPGYIDNHPPDEFTSVRDGGDYGWPYANPNPDTANGLDDMVFDPDFQNNRDGSLFSVSNFDRISKGIQAHSAPLGLTFLQDTLFGEAYRQGAIIALHGSWNRSRFTGYKLIYFPWNSSSQLPGTQLDLVTGWLDENAQQYWGRPVATVVDHSGKLIVSDDMSGAIYKISPASPISFDARTVSLVASNSGKCLQVLNGAADNGVPILQQACDGSSAQLWNITARSGTTYSLTAVNTGKSLDVTGGPDATADGISFQQWEYWGGDNQKFRILPNADGTFSVVADNSGKCLDVRGGPAAVADGVPLQQWTCWGGDNQKFRLVSP